MVVSGIAVFGKPFAVREDLAIELVRSHEMLVCPHLGAEAQVPVGS
jgi:hypothetical protein